jgi:hypothetical protein
MLRDMPEMPNGLFTWPPGLQIYGLKIPACSDKNIYVLTNKCVESATPRYFILIQQKSNELPPERMKNIRQKNFLLKSGIKCRVWSHFIH